MKVLIVGNIANNAYLIAKYLRRRGVEADVLCYNYYDIMASPEWEEAEIDGDWGANERPEWYKVDLHGYQRPEWFVQGPLMLALEYLGSKTPALWRKLSQSNFLSPPGIKYGILSFWRPAEWRILRKRSSFLFLLFSPTLLAICAFRFIRRFFLKQSVLPADTSSNIPAKFHGDLKTYLNGAAQAMKSVFAKYDIIQCHATDPIFPYVLGVRPYVAFEHGTLRHIPFNEDFIGVATKLAYQNADKVLITNCDNIKAAKKLGLENYVFLPHPVNEEGRSGEVLECSSSGVGKSGDGEVLECLNSRVGEGCSAGETAKMLREELDADYIVLHPARQHWEPDARHPDWEKGNDIFIRGFARFAKEVNSKAAAVFVEWGQRVPETKQLLSELGVADRVKWIRPLHHRKMVAYIEACDIFADQFHLGAFGSLTPKALLCGKAVLLNIDEKRHEWAFPEMPPVINVKSPDEVFEGLRKHYLDHAFRKDVEWKSAEWYWKHHSSKVITDKLIEIYTELINTRHLTTN